MNRTPDLERLRQVEVGWHRRLQDRPRPTTISAAGGSRQCREADVRASAPISGDCAKGGEAHLSAVGGDPDAVDAAAADDCDSPAAVGARTQQSESVVVDD